MNSKAGRGSLLAVLRHVGLRLAYGIPVIVIVSFSAAMLAELMPGSPAQAILGENATAEQIDSLNALYGYDRPPIERYLDWVGRALHGDLGSTLFTGRPVTELLATRVAVTVQLAAMAFVLALVLAVALALLASRHEGGIVDRAIAGLSSALLCVPQFVAAVVLAFLFAGVLHLLPATGWVPPSSGVLVNLRYAILPALSLALPEFAFFYRVIRAELGSTMREDFVLVARTKGLGRNYLLGRHVLRPSLNALITMMGMSIGRLLGGALIVETFFAVPGIGFETLNAVSDKDMNVLQALITLTVAVNVIVFIIVDLAYAWADPRVRTR